MKLNYEDLSSITTAGSVPAVVRPSAWKSIISTAQEMRTVEQYFMDAVQMPIQLDDGLSRMDSLWDIKLSVMLAILPNRMDHLAA